jgi:hypothetical protein
MAERTGQERRGEERLRVYERDAWASDAVCRGR